MFVRLVLFILLSFSVFSVQAEDITIKNLKTMFHNMVENKNIYLMSDYYNKDFLLYSNGKK